MKALLTKVFESFQEDFGHPVKLIRLLQDHPDICVSLNAPAPCIDAYSIAPWHELGESKHLYGPSRERGSLMGWKQRDKHSYGSFILHRPEYAQIVQRAIVEDWGCDITDVQGFAGSKSELRNFTSTDQMVETNSPDMIESISPAKLAENLAHREIRIIHAPGIDYFQRYAWDGRLFLINSGGSHHFAAAKYIAARLPQAVALRGKLVTHSLNALAIASLQRDYEMFVISDATPIRRGFHEAMEAFRATWLGHSMPRPLQNTQAILLPKAERRSMQVASLLRKAGVADLGAHLAHAAATQFTSTNPGHRIEI